MVSDKFLPHPGGTAVVMANWCLRWPHDRVRVVTHRPPGWQDFRSPLTIRRVGQWPRLRALSQWMGLWLHGFQQCHSWKPDVLHLGQITGTSYFAPLTGLPYVVNLHGEELVIGARSRLYRWVLRHAAGVTVNSSFTRGLLPGFGYDGPVLQVEPAVDSEFFVPGDKDEARRQLSLNGGPVLLTVARLVERKGHELILRALPRLKDRFPDLRYVVVGDGPLRAQLESHPDVTFLGRVDDARLRAAYQAADVFVHPNRVLADGDVEGFGVVFREAGACGLPVLGGDSGGVPDAVEHGRTGYLVTPETLPTRLAELLDNPEHARNLGRQGRARAQERTWDEAARRVWEFTSERCCRSICRTASG